MGALPKREINHEVHEQHQGFKAAAFEAVAPRSRAGMVHRARLVEQINLGRGQAGA